MRPPGYWTEYRREWWKRNKVKAKEYRLRYLAETPDREREAVRRYRERDPERAAEVQRRHRAKNGIAVLARATAYATAHKEQRRATQRRRNARKLGAPMDESVEFWWPAILRAYRNRCAYCGGIGQLEQDHVIPLSKGGSHTASNLRPACRGCNRRKHANTWAPRPWAAKIPGVDA